MAITFKEIKPYISRTVRISICFHDGHYDDYTMISDIAEGLYDDFYVFGIGLVDVEFPVDVYKRPFVALAGRRVSSKESCFGCGLEIFLQDEPRDIIRKNNQELQFYDLREYLASGMNFAVVMKEDWSEEQYIWRRDIPEEYNDLHVYGIGIDDNPEKLCPLEYAEIKDSHHWKRMVIVLAKTPREDIEKAGGI